MITKIALSILFGTLIGMEIQSKFNENLIKACNDLIKEKDEVIKSYDKYVEYLEGEYTLEFQDAINQLLKENINLRKKLKGCE